MKEKKESLNTHNMDPECEFIDVPDPTTTFSLDALYARCHLLMSPTLGVGPVLTKDGMLSCLGLRS